MQVTELKYLLAVHAKKGGKTSKKKQAARVLQFLAFSRVKGPDQIGNRHVYLWYEEKNSQGKILSESTLRDRFYAVCLLWELLGRSGRPPRPRSAKIAKNSDANQRDCSDPQATESKAEPR